LRSTFDGSQQLPGPQRTGNVHKRRAVFHRNCGRSSVSATELESAATCFQASIESDPSRAPAYFNLIHTLELVSAWPDAAYGGPTAGHVLHLLREGIPVVIERMEDLDPRRALSALEAQAKGQPKKPCGPTEQMLLAAASLASSQSDEVFVTDLMSQLRERVRELQTVSDWRNRLARVDGDSLRREAWERESGLLCRVRATDALSKRVLEFAEMVSQTPAPPSPAGSSNYLRRRKHSVRSCWLGIRVG